MLPPVQITPNVIFLGTSYFNLYLVKGETYALIEGGVSAITYPFLAQLGQCGIDPGAISYLVVLHSHFDHMMVLPTLLEQRPSLQVVSSKANGPIFSNERIMGKIYDSDHQVTLALQERGSVSEVPWLTRRFPFPLDLPVTEGTILDLGEGVEIKFLETPGHSPDSLAAWIEKEGVLFCSDAAGFYVPPDFFRPNYWFSLSQAESSLEKMKGLDPQYLCRGHYGVMVGQAETRRHLARGKESIDRFKTFILERVRNGVPVDEIAEDITDRFSIGVLEFFPRENNLRLWKLLVRRTLEHFGIELEGLR